MTRGCPALACVQSSKSKCLTPVEYCWTKQQYREYQSKYGRLVAGLARGGRPFHGGRKIKYGNDCVSWFWSQDLMRFSNTENLLLIHTKSSMVASRGPHSLKSLVRWRERWERSQFFGQDPNRLCSALEGCWTIRKSVLIIYYYGSNKFDQVRSIFFERNVDAITFKKELVQRREQSEKSQVR